MRKSSSVVWSLLLLSSIAGIIIYTVMSPHPIPRPPEYQYHPTSQPKVKNSVFAQWKDMRARRVPEGTKVRWRLKVWCVLSDHYIGNLEGNWDYGVRSPWGLLFGRGEQGDKVLNVTAPADGDWVEIQGRFAGVSSRGDVMVVPDHFTNLGPGY